MRKSRELFLFLSLCFFLICACEGVAELFPYGLDARDSSLSRDNDDISSPEFRLSVPIVLYGTRHNSVYVNQNGLVSFKTDIPIFVNMQFPLDYPSIAALYSDVDTRLGGSIYYRETQGSDLLARADKILRDHFTSASNFQPTSLLIVTWDGVGYFDRKSDKANTFQIVVANDGTDSYVIFNYKNIEWIQGTGKNPSLPDAKGQAGLISGHGPHFTLPGSGTDQISSVHKRSNLGEKGVWAFHVGNVREQIEEPDLNLGLDTTSESSASCAGGATQCHSQAQCVDYSPGFCCQCVQGFFGNGRTCLQDATPQRVTGKVKGVLNGVAIEDADLFSYVLPQDGRAYTAVAKLPERLGYDFQTLSILGTIVAWLFSIPVKGAPNGFKLTGGVFNYTAEISFQQTGQKLSIHQQYTGLDVFSHLKVETRVHGTTAIIPVGKSIEVNDYEMLLTRISPGVIRSQSNHNYRVEGTSSDYPFSVEQTINYDECPWVSPVTPELETTKLKIGRNYIIYDVAQQIARYATTSKVTPREGDDPCKENKDKCGPNSSCVARDDSFSCICSLGYEEYYREGGERDAQIKECVDIDECAIGTSTCDVTANCINLAGSHACQCQPGYSGDGYTCTKILSCHDVQCGQNARCVEASIGEPECRCLQGFTGDGLFCYETTGQDVGPGTAPDCRQVRNLCDPFADCIFSKSSRSYICSCKNGYTGDGIVCMREASETCDARNTCHINAVCRLDEYLKENVCVCRSGYVGDGFHCSPEEVPSTNPEPTCLLNYCWCPTGYVHENNKCHYAEEIPSPDSTCEIDHTLCDANAACLHQRGAYLCVCKAGYSGDGHSCVQEQEGRNPTPTCLGQRCWCPPGYAHDDIRRTCRYVGTSDSNCDVDPSLCDRNAFCSEPERDRFECVCNAGFTGDGQSCTEISDQPTRHPEPTCLRDHCWCPAGYTYDINRRACDQTATPVSICGPDEVTCDANAFCRLEGNTYSCVCNAGYSGDGRSCTPQSTCSSHEECGEFGECAYDRRELRYACSCREGYEVDGRGGCRPKGNVGCDVTRNCDPRNGHCAWDHTLARYACRCKPGFIGDGIRCEEDANSCNVLRNCGKNGECVVDEEQRAYKCQCKQGYDGDGYRCKSNQPCYVDKTICDVNAQCSPDRESREWKCRCNEGFFGDGEICQKEILRDENVLLVTKGMSVIRIPLSGEEPEPLTVEPFQTAIGIDIDCPNQKVYWSDVAGREIKQASFNGTGKSSFLENNIGSPEGLALDWPSGNLYWTDSLKDTIEVANLKTKNRKTLINTNLVNPRGIAVYPNRGRLFWSDWNRDYPKIEFTGLDGLGRQVLVGEGLALPNSLVVDVATDQLCWGDAGTHKIECVGIDGRNRRTLIQGIKYPFGLVLTGDTFYWSDWETKKIESASRTSGEQETSINVALGGPGKLYGLVLIPTKCPQAHSPCAYNHCRDNQICLPNIRGGISCRCSDSASAECVDST